MIFKTQETFLISPENKLLVREKSSYALELGNILSWLQTITKTFLRS